MSLKKKFVKPNNVYFFQQKMIWSDLVVKNNCHPFKLVILTWAHLPPWILLSFSIRSLCEKDLGKNTTLY